MNAAELLEFLDVFTGDAFDVSPEVAIAYFQAKGLQPTFSYADMLGEANDQAFTVAKMMDVDLLAQVRKSLDDALAGGESFNAWKAKLEPSLIKAGWWGAKDMVDPLTGNVVAAQLGSPWRLETIFRTNLQTAYAVGQWQEIEAQIDVAPYLMYDAVDDTRTRPEHAAWDRTVLPANHKWWRTHFPPNGYNCRCSVIQLDKDEVEALGLEVDDSAPPGGTYSWKNPRTGQVLEIPDGIDPGFNRNPGKAHQEMINKLAVEKIAGLPDDMGIAAKRALAPILDPETAAKLAAEAKEAAAQQVAQAAIEAALAANTPWLASAIKSLQKTASAKAMKPADLLKAAQQKAAKSEQGHLLYDYKQALLKGKAPNAKVQQVFDSLPPDEQAAITAQITEQVAKNAAQAALDKLAAGEGNLKLKQALKQLQVAGDADKIGPVELLAKVEQLANDMQAKAVATAAVNAYKKNAIAGKIPTPVQKAAFDALPDAEKAKLLDEIDKAKTPPAPPEVPAPASPAPAAINPATLTQIGPQRGSNPGGLYQDTETGVQWYIKRPGSEDKVRNEVLAGKLYQAAGVDVPDLEMLTMNGEAAIASRIIDGLSKSTAEGLGIAPGAREGFMVDAWLANWDVVGLGYDNLLLRAGKAVRVDTGGALRYRAQGTLKGSAWGDTVGEIDSLRNPGTNSQAASVFGGITQDELLAGARRVLAIDEQTIRDLVRQYGPADPDAAEALVRTLLARQADIARRFPEAVTPKVAPLPKDADRLVSDAEAKTIADARINGYAIRTDGGDIEDHNVTVSVIEGPKGKVTRAYFKVLPATGQRIEAELAKYSGAPVLVFNPNDLGPKILELVIGINSRAAKGAALEQKNIDRWNILRPQMRAALGRLDNVQADPRTLPKAKAEAARQRAVISEWFDKFERATDGATASSIPKVIDGKFDKDALTTITQTAESSGGPPWEKNRGWSVPTTDIKRGFAKFNGGKQMVPGVQYSYRLADGDTTIDYVPFTDNGSGRAFQGTVQIDVNGDGAEAAIKAIEAVEKLGIAARRATDADRQELYLNKIARLYTVRSASGEEAWRKIDDIADQQKRIEAKVERVNALAGKDVRATDQWGSYTGTYQAFGHGRALQYRPDLNDVDFQDFANNYVIYNNPTGLGLSADSDMWEQLRRILEGGGMYSSRSDLVRRGVEMAYGTSVSADIKTGGGNYMFTRLRSKQRAIDLKHAGIFWRASHMRRLDAISYPGDKFGETTDEMQRNQRKIKPDEWRKVAGENSNETIFKDGMSIFDDVEVIVFPTKASLQDALRWFKENGYTTWPDGRQLTDVLKARVRE